MLYFLLFFGKFSFFFVLLLELCRIKKYRMTRRSYGTILNCVRGIIAYLMDDVS